MLILGFKGLSNDEAPITSQDINSYCCYPFAIIPMQTNRGVEINKRK